VTQITLIRSLTDAVCLLLKLAVRTELHPATLSQIETLRDEVRTGLESIGATIIAAR
jgi:hypothetical protein